MKKEYVGNPAPSKTFRITYRMEVYIKAETKEEAIADFENMRREQLDETARYVERVSIDEEQ